MAIDFTAKYPGRFDPVSALYPQGKFKNRSAPNTEDGSYMERDWLNDWNGFFGALLKNGGVTPNGTVDTATTSQLYDALRAVILGILPKRTFATNDFIRIPDVPGGLIIQWFSVNSANVATTTVSLPVSFPTAILHVSASGYNVSGGIQTTVTCNSPGASLSQVSFNAFAANTPGIVLNLATLNQVRIQSIAIGY